MIILVCRLYLIENVYFYQFKQHAFQLIERVQKDGEYLFINIIRVFATVVACKMRNLNPASDHQFFLCQKVATTRLQVSNIICYLCERVYMLSQLTICKRASFSFVQIRCENFQNKILTAKLCPVNQLCIFFVREIVAVSWRVSQGSGRKF